MLSYAHIVVERGIPDNYHNLTAFPFHPVSPQTIFNSLIEGWMDWDLMLWLYLLQWSWSMLLKGSRKIVSAGFRTAWVSLKPLRFPLWKEWVRFPLTHPSRNKHRKAFSTTPVFRNGQFQIGQWLSRAWRNFTGSALSCLSYLSLLLQTHLQARLL